MKFIFVIAASSLAFGCGLTAQKSNSSRNLDGTQSTASIDLVCSSEATSYQSGLQLVSETCVPETHSKELLTNDSGSFDLSRGITTSSKSTSIVMKNSSSSQSTECKISDDGAGGVELSESCIKGEALPTKNENIKITSSDSEKCEVVESIVNGRVSASVKCKDSAMDSEQDLGQEETPKSNKSTTSSGTIKIKASGDDCQISESSSGNVGIKASCNGENLDSDQIIEKDEKTPTVVVAPTSDKSTTSSGKISIKATGEDCQITENTSGDVTVKANCNGQAIEPMQDDMPIVDEEIKKTGVTTSVAKVTVKASGDDCEVAQDSIGNATVKVSCNGQDIQPELDMNDPIEMPAVVTEMNIITENQEPSDPANVNMVNRVSKKISCIATENGQECTKSEISIQDQAKHVKRHRIFEQRKTTIESLRARFAELKASVLGKITKFDASGLNCEKIVSQKENHVFISTVCSSK